MTGMATTSYTIAGKTVNVFDVNFGEREVTVGAGTIRIEWIYDDTVEGVRHGPMLVYCHGCDKTLSSKTTTDNTYDIAEWVTEGHPGPFDISMWTTADAKVSVSVASNDATMGDASLDASKSGINSKDYGGNFGEKVSYEIVATPKHGYQFDHWESDTGNTWNTARVTISVTLTDMIITRSYKAYFTKKQYTITGDTSGVSEGGTVTPSSSTGFAGDTVTFNAIAASGYYFGYWRYRVYNEDGSYDTQYDSSSATLSYKITGGPCSVTAFFFADDSTVNYTVSVSGGGVLPGSVVPTAGNVPHGTMVTATATPTYDDWYVWMWQNGNDTFVAGALTDFSFLPLYNNSATRNIKVKFRPKITVEVRIHGKGNLIIWLQDGTEKRGSWKSFNVPGMSEWEPISSADTLSKKDYFYWLAVPAADYNFEKIDTVRTIWYSPDSNTIFNDTFTSPGPPMPQTLFWHDGSYNVCYLIDVYFKPVGLLLYGATNALLYGTAGSLLYGSQSEG